MKKIILGDIYSYAKNSTSYEAFMAEIGKWLDIPPTDARCNDITLQDLCDRGKPASENDTEALRLQNVVPSYSDKVRAWWGHLTNGQKRDYELKTFGSGNAWEDNSLVYGDIERMYRTHS